MSKDPLSPWAVLKDLPSRAKVEVYIRGTGLWAEATLIRLGWGVNVMPVEPDLRKEHSVSIEYDWTAEQKDVAALLVRLPHDPKYRVEDGPYRKLLEGVSEQLLHMVFTASTFDNNTTSAATVKAAVKHLLTSGGFMRDLWSVFKDVLKERFKPEEDDILYRILQELQADEKR